MSTIEKKGIKYFLKKPGTYMFTVVEEKTKSKSNNANVNVKSIKGKQKQAADIFGNYFNIGSWKENKQNIGKNKNDITKLIKEFPKTPYAKYAKYFSFKREYRSVKHSTPNNECKLASLHRKYENLIGQIPSPSKWHAELLYKLTELVGISMGFCKGRYGGETVFKERIKKIERLYPNTEYSTKVQKLKEEFELWKKKEK